jgi:hypothetical protein
MSGRDEEDAEFEVFGEVGFYPGDWVEWVGVTGDAGTIREARSRGVGRGCRLLSWRVGR